MSRSQQPPATAVPAAGRDIRSRLRQAMPSTAVGNTFSSRRDLSALDTLDGPPPMRPARSVRRPRQAAEEPGTAPLMRSGSRAGFIGAPNTAGFDWKRGALPGEDLNLGDYDDEAISPAEERPPSPDTPFGRDRLSPTSPNDQYVSVGSLTNRGITTPQMTNVLAAFRAAGRKGKMDHAHANGMHQRKGLRYEIDDEAEDEPAFREINTVLRKVKNGWGFVLDDDFNAVTLALSLLDESSVGGDRTDFERTKEQLERALQGTVDDHYQSFASAITLHHSVLTSLTNAQQSLHSARNALVESREALGTKRADLVQMWGRKESLREMLRLLDTLEHLKSVPDQLESLMSEKRFLQAVHLLTRSVKTIEKPDLVEIGATSDLRIYLKGQEAAMFDILIEELHNHLYLKSFFCDTRWKSYSFGQDRLPWVDFGVDADEPQTMITSSSSMDLARAATLKPSSSSQPRLTKLARYLTSLSLRPSVDPLSASGAINDIEPMTVSISSTSLAAEAGATTPNVSRSGTPVPGSGPTDSVTPNELNNSASTPPQSLGINNSPESDSFMYMEMLLESLAALGKLDLALDVVSQRLPVELYALVDSTITEVDERNEPLRRTSALLRPSSMVVTSLTSRLSRTSMSSGNTRPWSLFGAPGSAPNILQMASGGDSSGLQIDGETIKDLFWTLFSKLDAVLQGHRVVAEVTRRIASRRDFKKSSDSKFASTLPLMEVWKTMQSEVRTLLHDYLTDDEGGRVKGRNPIVSINEVLRTGSARRDRNKTQFKFSDSGLRLDKKLGSALKPYEHSLDNALKASVPGLVASIEQTSSSAVASQQVVMSALSSSETYSGVGHRLLVRPDAFNVSILFRPTLAFVERVQAIMPDEAAAETSKGFTSFLEEFVLDVFLPQLEDKVSSFMHSTIDGAEAFQEEPLSRKLAQKPIVKSAANLTALVNSLYTTLRTMPFHRENYSRLIISTIVQYYQRCNDRFKVLVAVENMEVDADGIPTGPTLKLAASWAQRAELSSLLGDIFTTSDDSDDSSIQRRKKELIRRENEMELSLVRESDVSSKDLIMPTKKLVGLGSLYHSLRWFIGHIERFKVTSDATFEPEDSAPPESDAADASSPTPIELKLPLTESMVARYETLPRTYQELCNVVLCTLRLEIRCRTIHYLDLTASEGNYYLEDGGAVEPDPHVVDLNTELAQCDEAIATTLPRKEHRFIFDGLASLMDELLVSSARKIRAANKLGVIKMIRNILALQQNLKNIVDVPLDTDFDKSKRFWELFSKDPKASCSSSDMIAMISREKPTQSFEDYKAMLGLQLGIDNTSGKEPAASTVGLGGDKNRRLYNEYLIDLHQAIDSHDL